MGDTFDRRKTDVQDILSSFSRNTLPSEFRPELFAKINKDQGRRPPLEWTIPEDLEGSLMQWGVHDDDCYNFLQRAQPSGTRSVLFHQKVARRLRAELERCHQIDRSLSPGEIWGEVLEVSTHLRRIVEASWNRQLMEGGASRALPFIETLSELCENCLDVSKASPHTRLSNRSHPETILFHMLVIEAPPGQDHFMLGLLEWMVNNSAENLSPLVGALESIASQLAQLNAPESYWKKFQEITEKANRTKQLR